MDYKVNDEVTVLAWWKKKLPVKCRITTVYEKKNLESAWYEDKTRQFVMVQPLDGNPHQRYVNVEDIVCSK